MAEASAVRDGLILAAEQEATRVVLETDNATVATLVRSDDGFRSVIAGVWHEIRELSLSFASFICAHVNREGNEAAHLCARRPSASSPVISWVGDLPNWLMEVANKDCNIESY
jgi:ribonuclease HI